MASSSCGGHCETLTQSHRIPPHAPPKSSEARGTGDWTDSLREVLIFLQLILLGESQQQGRNLLNYINIIVTRKIQ